MSRYGVVSMANTLDQVSLFAKNIEDMKLLASITSSCDSNDMTSILEEYEFIDEDYDFSGKKIGVISTDTDIYEGIEDTVKDDYKSAIERLEKLGAEIHTVDFKYAKFANPVYNVVMSSEVSSNMSRFDGIRFGHQTENYDNLDDLFIKSRSEGFGEEVQRRIALGTMYLSASDNQRIYKKGLQLRTLIKKELENLLKEYDLIITPTTTNLPTKITENKDNLIVNLAGMCGISVPVRSGLSGSIQFIGNRFDDNKILNAAQRFIKEAK